MTLQLLKSVARSLMRTAKRRIKDYMKSGVKNPQLEDLMENIQNRPYVSEKGTLTMRGLSQRELEELVEVQRELRDISTAKQYKKNVQSIFENVGYPSNTDVNLFYRAIKTFEAIHGLYYKEWTNYVERAGEITSKGDTLANWYKAILDEQSGKEYSDEEVAGILSDQTGFESF